MCDARFGDMTQYEFLCKWESVAVDDEDAMANIRADMKRFIATIVKGTIQYAVNDGDGVSIIKWDEYESYLKSTYITNESHRPGNGDKAEISLYDIFEPISLDEDIMYDGTCFSLEPKDGYLNLFRGYKAKVRDRFNPVTIDVIREHILRVLAAGNKEHARYIEQWIAHMLFNPDKVGVALFFIGEAGVGKTLFFERLVEYTIGDQNALCTDTIQRITSRFNGALMNRRLIMTNEVGGCSPLGYHRLKSLITDRLISIEHKGEDLVQAVSSHWFVFLSSYADQRFIEDNDRRFAIFQCGPKQDDGYYRRLARALECGDDIITWLKEIYDKDFDLKKIPVTTLKKQLMEDNRHPVQQFLDGVPHGEYPSSKIYNDYREWCRNWGCTPVIKARMVASSGGRLLSLGQRMVDGVRDTYWLIK